MTPPTKPGEFNARCRLKRRVPEERMTPELWDRAVALDYTREFLEMASGRVDKEKHRRGRWEIVFQSCDGFETTDRVAFDEHMANLHGRKLSGPKRRPSMWKPPRLTVDGRPWEDTDGRTQTCPDCGLVAEVDTTEASALWWREHLKFCTAAIGRRAS